jgi:hypothetical protein
MPTSDSDVLLAFLGKELSQQSGDNAVLFCFSQSRVLNVARLELLCICGNDELWEMKESAALAQLRITFLCWQRSCHMFVVSVHASRSYPGTQFILGGSIIDWRHYEINPFRPPVLRL